MLLPSSIAQIANRLKETIAGYRNEKFAKALSYLTEYGIEYNAEVLRQHHKAYNSETDINSTNLTHLSDLESLGLSSNIGTILDVSSVVHAGFVILKEKNGQPPVVVAGIQSAAKSAEAFGPRQLVIIDEAGMADTLSLDAVVQHVLGRGGSVRLIGDDQRSGSVRRSTRASGWRCGTDAT